MNITRDSARAQGLKRFWTGVPCEFGHDSERYVSSGGCIDCLNMRTNRARKEKRKDGKGRTRARVRTPHVNAPSTLTLSAIAKEFGAEPFTVADLAARGLAATKRWLDDNIGQPNGGYCVVAAEKFFGTPAWRLLFDLARAAPV